MLSNSISLDLNKEIVLNFLKLSFSNQVHESLKLLAEDATWWVSGPPERLKVSGPKNRAQIERLLKSVGRLVPDGMRTTIRGITAEGQRVAIEVGAEGTTTAGKSYHNAYHFLFELSDGLIISVREYMDTLHLFDVLND